MLRVARDTDEDADIFRDGEGYLPCHEAILHEDVRKQRQARRFALLFVQTRPRLICQKYKGQSFLELAAERGFGIDSLYALIRKSPGALRM